MAGREVREYTNLTDPKDKKLGKGKERVDDEEITFQRMVAKFSDNIPGRDLGFLNWVVEMYRCKRLQENGEVTFMDEAMEAEEDAERILRRTEKRAFADFKKAVAETSPASVPLPLRVEPKPKSGIRQQDLLKRMVEVKPKRQRVSSPSDGKQSSVILSRQESGKHESGCDQEKEKEKNAVDRLNKAGEGRKLDNPVKSLLAAYESSDEEE